MEIVSETRKKKGTKEDIKSKRILKVRQYPFMEASKHANPTFYFDYVYQIKVIKISNMFTIFYIEYSIEQ